MLGYWDNPEDTKAIIDETAGFIPVISPSWMKTAM